MIVLDTTVLVYATGTAHPLQEPSRRIIAAVAHGDLEATTTVEVIQEFVHVRARRRPRSDAAELGAAYADLLAPLRPVSQDDLLQGLRIYRECGRLGAVDAVLAATALSLPADALISADGAFAEVKGLTHRMPDLATVLALLDR